MTSVKVASSARKIDLIPMRWRFELKRALSFAKGMNTGAKLFTVSISAVVERLNLRIPQRE